jgi:hypothetical protein
MKKVTIPYSSVNLNTLPRIIVALESVLELDTETLSDEQLAEETRRRIAWAKQTLRAAGVDLKE